MISSQKEVCDRQLIIYSMKNILILLLLLFVQPLFSQKSVRVAFWNVENLFDTINPPNIRYTTWTGEKYIEKTSNLKRVITDLNPAIMGLCEVENSEVIEDILPDGFRYIHYDSPDPRAIDVAMIYDPRIVELISSEPIRAHIKRRTRDILRADFNIHGNQYTIFVVHLPSKRGNDPQAQIDRQVINRQIDSLITTQPQVIVCGDFNQNRNRNLLPNLYNTSAQSYAEGRGSYAYRDTWQMYDQIFVSNSLRTEVLIHTKGLIQPFGRFKGYPYRGKFSDHLPVFIELRH